MCPGVSDCGDQSDERQCGIVQYPESRHYSASIPPITRDSEGETRPVMVGVSVDIINIAGVMETALQWKVKFNLTMSWTDARLQWRHLRANNNLNIIPLTVGGVF